jgi:NADH:ubiquinone oxidoreductase subunit 4 (subunit M)
MPLFCFFFRILIFANFGFPGTASFIAEIYILLGLSQINFTLLILFITNLFFGAAYSL